MMLSVATQLPARRPSRSRWTPAGTPLHWHVLALLLCSAAVAAQAAGLSTGTCNSRLVQTSGQFATALATPDASVLQLAGLTPLACCLRRARTARCGFAPPLNACCPSRLAGTLTLLPTDYSTPIIMAARNVTIEPGADCVSIDSPRVTSSTIEVLASVFPPLLHARAERGSTC